MLDCKFIVEAMSLDRDYFENDVINDRIVATRFFRLFPSYIAVIMCDSLRYENVYACNRLWRIIFYLFWNNNFYVAAVYCMDFYYSCTFSFCSSLLRRHTRDTWNIFRQQTREYCAQFSDLPIAFDNNNIKSVRNSHFPDARMTCENNLLAWNFLCATTSLYPATDRLFPVL